MFEIRPYKKDNKLYYDPFHDLDAFERGFFGEPFDSLWASDTGAFKVDIVDNGESYGLVADLPGCEKENIHLGLKGDTLTVSAERHSEHEDSENKDKYIRVERSWGKYSRSFDVSGIDTENIRAKYDNGVLKITLPKKQSKPTEDRSLDIE